MPVKRSRSNNERDMDQTRRLILDAAAEVLKEKGHAFFSADQIANRARVDPRLIKHHFGSLNGLLKMLIHENDFWMPVLNNFDPAEDLKTYCKKVLNQQLDFFLEHKEMQRFILWQISEYNPVISSVANLRDEEGRKILALCREYFAGSDTDFEATVAIIVTGIYGIVLQTLTGNSPVCGLDVRNERDRMRLYQAIDRLIEREWEFASERRSWQ